MDDLLWLASSVAEAVVIGLLFYRRVWRTLPFFCIYCVWILLSSVGAYAVLRFHSASYFTAYLSETVIESALEICVLIELAWSVLRPLRASLPRGAWVVVAGLVVALGAAIWPFAMIPGFGNLPAKWHFLMHLQQTTSILRILFFLALAGGSQLLSIGWRNRELQVATGLGIYSFVSIAVAMLHTHQTMGAQYNLLDEIEVASYLCSLLYWVFSFAQQEAERRAFTPQMQNFLLAAAGTARSTRLAMAEASAGHERRRGE
jgi:hypothetical protein